MSNKTNRWGECDGIDPKCQQCKQYVEIFDETICKVVGPCPDVSCDLFIQATEMDIIQHKMENVILPNLGCTVDGFEDEDLSFELNYIGYAVVSLSNNQTLIYKTGFDGKKQLITDEHELKKVNRWIEKHNNLIE